MPAARTALLRPEPGFGGVGRGKASSFAAETFQS